MERPQQVACPYEGCVGGKTFHIPGCGRLSICRQEDIGGLTWSQVRERKPCRVCFFYLPQAYEKLSRQQFFNQLEEEVARGGQGKFIFFAYPLLMGSPTPSLRAAMERSRSRSRSRSAEAHTPGQAS